MMGDAMASDLLAGREPYPGQRLHPLDELVQHGNAQRTTGDERMQADVEIAAAAVLLTKARPPHLEHPVRIGKPLLAGFALKPREIVEHRIVDRVVERQFDETGASVGGGRIARSMAHTAV